MPEIRVDVKQIEDKIATQFSFPRDSWSWHTVRILSDHVLIHLHVMISEPGRIVPVVWSRDGTISVWDPDSQDSFIQFMKDEGLSIGDNLEDILDVFCFSQPYRRILRSMADLEEQGLIPEEKRSLLSTYAESIGPVICSFTEGKERARFWTIDYGFGNLEEWLFVQEEARWHIQSWVREQRLIPTLLGR